MTTSKIEPALTAEEWVNEETITGVTITRDGFTRRELSRNGHKLAVNHRVSLDVGDAYFGLPEIPGLLALANAALPDSDPRKITRAKIDDIRGALTTIEDDRGGEESDARAWLDALASYLPPEGT